MKVSKKIILCLIALSITTLNVGCSNSSENSNNIALNTSIREEDAIKVLGKYLNKDELALYFNSGEVEINGVKYYSMEDMEGADYRFLVSINKGEVFYESSGYLGELIPIEEYLAEKKRTEEIYGSIKLKDYKEVLKFYEESGNKINKLLNDNNIEAIVASNKSLIISKEHSYEKYEKRYKQLFVHNAEVDFDSGEGKYNLEIDKEMHIDTEVTIEDSYINVMYQLYKNFYPKTTEDDFIKQLNGIIETAKTEGYTTDIIEGDSLINIDATVDDATLRLYLNIEKDIEVTPVAPITKEYSTITEFNGAFKKILANNTKLDLNNFDQWSSAPEFYDKLGESGVKNMYTIKYESNTSDNFSEKITVNLFNYRNMKSPANEYSTSLYLENGILNADENDKTYIKKGVEKFKDITGVDIYNYMTEDEFLKEVETSYLRRQVFDTYAYTEFRDYGTKTSTSIPVPGMNDLRIDFSTIPPKDSGSIHTNYNTFKKYGDEIDKLTAGNIEYIITLELDRPVVAEGITRK